MQGNYNMIGKILGYDKNNNTGIISADNGTRYKFSKEDWKENNLPQKEMKVDFEPTDENNAKDIYVVQDQLAENTNTLLGLIAIGITFFFGFIGTFISRLFIAKEPLGNVIIPTIIHFIITVLVIIPILGWLIYFIGTCYYMYKNYMLVTQPEYNPFR
jgi:uncharacterized membrane protein (DUF106 family)